MLAGPPKAMIAAIPREVVAAYGVYQPRTSYRTLDTAEVDAWLAE